MPKVIMLRNAEKGAFRWKTTAVALGVVTLPIMEERPRPLNAPLGSLMASPRSTLNFTSVELKGVPSSYFNPDLRMKVYVSPSELPDHLVASAGWRFDGLVLVVPGAKSTRGAPRLLIMLMPK